MSHAMRGYIVVKAYNCSLEFGETRLKVVFTKYDDSVDEFVALFEISLQENKLLPSNGRGASFLQNLQVQKSRFSDKVGGNLLREGKYEELLHHMTKRYTSPYFGAHLED